MSYPGIVLPFILGVGLAVAAVCYFLGPGGLQSPQSDSHRKNAGPPPYDSGPYTHSWEQDCNKTRKPKRRQRTEPLQNECIICLEELKVGLTKLPCEHIFHKPCITRWLQEVRSCPLCRKAAL